MKSIIRVKFYLVVLMTICCNTVLSQDPQDLMKESVLKIQASKYSNEANEALNKGEYAKARELYSKYIEIYPNNGRIYIARALTKELLDNDLGAIEDYTLAIKMEPRSKYYMGSFGYRMILLKDVDAYYKRGLSYARLGRLENALSDLSMSLILDPEHKDSYRSRGLVRLQMGDNAGCEDIRIYRQLEEFDFTHLNQTIQENCNFD